MTTNSEQRVLDGRYQLLSKLGQGGMGSVWLAEDQLLERPVALKELVPDSGSLELRESRARAVVEARAMALVKHPAIVRIHDLFFIDGEPWIVMEYVSGRSLADKILDGRLDECAIARIGLPVLQGLRAVHCAGVVHRDVKPANILVADDDSIFLVDFGIAKIAGDRALTGQRRVLGTPEFLAPERIMGRTAGPASDLWSLGVTLFYALEGYSPFLRRGERGQEATTAAILQDNPRPERRGRLADVVVQLLRKEPSRRPDAAEVEQALTSIRAGHVPRPVATATAPMPRTAVSQVAVLPGTALKTQAPPVPPRSARQPVSPGSPNGAALSGRSLANAVEIIGKSGIDSAKEMLLAMPDEQAAQVLARCKHRKAGELIQAIAVTRPRTAGSILQILSVSEAGRAVDYLSPGTAVSILEAISVKESVRILSHSDVRTAAGVLMELPSPISAQLVMAMPDGRASAVLGFVKPTTVAALLRDAPDDLSARLLSQLNEQFRALVRRHL